MRTTRVRLGRRKSFPLQKLFRDTAESADDAAQIEPAAAFATQQATQQATQGIRDCMTIGAAAYFVTEHTRCKFHEVHRIYSRSVC
ncbi:MAG: hypothetical protein ACI9TH_004900 [Kiritimatiellia bacterium]|jgi:hypothetical protein